MRITNLPFFALHESIYPTLPQLLFYFAAHIINLKCFATLFHRGGVLEPDGFASHFIPFDVRFQGSLSRLTLSEHIVYMLHVTASSFYMFSFFADVA